MYQCKQCGNQKYFIEHNYVETELTLDPLTGEPSGSHDTVCACVEVVCGICHANSEDGDIVDRHSGEPIRL